MPRRNSLMQGRLQAAQYS